jgi:hypothetical protein
MRRSQLATILLLLATAPAAAEELQLGARVVTRYNDEVVRGEGDGDDVIYDFGPSVQLRGEHRRFEYSISPTSSIRSSTSSATSGTSPAAPAPGRSRRP